MTLESRLLDCYSYGLAEKSCASFSTEWEAKPKPIAPCTGDICRVSVKSNVTLFNVGSSFSYETGMNGSRRPCALSPPLSIRAPFYGYLKIYGYTKQTFKWPRIGLGTFRSESCALANWATTAPLLAKSKFWPIVDSHWFIAIFASLCDWSE